MKELNPNYYPPTIDTPNGKLQGFLDDGIYTFLGVPYAEAGRFEHPKEVKPWGGVKRAFAPGPTCPTELETVINENKYFTWPYRKWVEREDCQNLNVWTPSIDPSAKKPVVVFIHGGRFDFGTSLRSYDSEGRNLSQFGDVVVVSCNHRLNILGNLDLSGYGEEFANSGNLMMEDLAASLKWVHNNIESFGGDPDRVVIFGQSGGSSKVANLFYIPEADSLYSGGMGCSYGAPGYMEAGESAEIADRLLSKLAIKRSEVERLKSYPYEALIKAAGEVLEEMSQDKGRRIMFAPTRDGSYFRNEMTQYAKTVPYVCGSDFSEFHDNGWRGIHDKNDWTEEQIQKKLSARFEQDKDLAVSEFRRLFPEKGIQDILFYNDRWNWKLLTSTAAEAPEIAAAQSHAGIYHYMFSFEAPVLGGITAFHGGELHYLFHNVDLPQIRLATGGTVSCHKMQDIFASVIINLARTGNPSPDGIEWKTWTRENRETMIFDEETVCKPFNDKVLSDLVWNHPDDDPMLKNL